ncbi:MAG TPA: hypothetical protein VHF22_14870, partial [Planctomycetota bacterium]|nr:hypothetical protein [Planctomycetota bacterium]
QSRLRILHYDAAAGAWVDVTTGVDTASHTVCGSVSSLSPFAIGLYRSTTSGGHLHGGCFAGPAGGGDPAALLPLAALVAALGLARVRRRRRIAA